MQVPDLPWALGLPEPAISLVRRQGFVSAARAGSNQYVDFDLVHVRHDIASPVFLP